MKIAIKPGVSLLYNIKDKRFQFSISTSNIQKIYEMEPEYVYFFKLLSKYDDDSIIFSEIQARFPNFKRKEFISTIEILRREGIISIKQPIPATISHEESIRYNRQVNFFSNLNPEKLNPWDFQNKLKTSKVLILGIGGIGSWIAQYLTMSGLGEIYICDFDIVELHNLTRQTLYSVNDLGKKKTDALEKKSLIPSMETLTSKK
ncbi:HesA/MoeB/ThiF family protein [Streptococcus rifensis]